MSNSTWTTIIDVSLAQLTPSSSLNISPMIVAAPITGPIEAPINWKTKTIEKEYFVQQQRQPNQLQTQVMHADKQVCVHVQ